MSARTSDPVADAERASEDSRPIIGHCDECGCDIHGENALYEADEYYEINGDKVCEDCLQSFMDRWYRVTA